MLWPLGLRRMLGPALPLLSLNVTSRLHVSVLLYCPPAVPFSSYVLGLYKDSLSEKSLQRLCKSGDHFMAKQTASFHEAGDAGNKVMQAAGNFAKGDA